MIQSGEKLQVRNALTDDRWANSAGLQHGLISYLGYPLILPNRQVFGTICLMDTQSKTFSTAAETLLRQYKEIIETHLELLAKSKALRIMRQKYSDSLRKSNN